MIQINEKLVKYNFSKRTNSEIKYIVIHDTGNMGVKANADAHYNYFNSADRQSSAHYFIDDKQILRIIKDSDKAWHCGDGNGKYGITNDNSIGIEMCINKDGDFGKTYNNTLLLTKHLMIKYNISIDNVVRHYDASRKTCPHIWAKDKWAKWDSFKLDLTKLINKGTCNKKDYKPFIQKLYKNLYNRDADTDGLNYWDKKLNDGLSFGDLLKSIGDSKEFDEIYAPMIK